MARAKRTDRAEARRRYRETHPEEQAAAPLAGEVVEAPEIGRPTRTAAIAERPSLIGSLRRSMGRPDFAGDVRALPQIAIHSKALWVPILLIAGTAFAFTIPGLQQNPIVSILVQVALTPPPMIMPFLGGMLAPRGAWLVGGIIGFANWVGFAALFLFLDTRPTATPLGWTFALTNDQRMEIVFGVIVQSIPFGILVGAFAGFYRRFLASSSPARQAARQSARPNQKRR